MILGLVCLCALFLAVSVRADEFRAVVVTDQESAALRAAKTRADEAQAAFVKLRSAAEERYKSRFQQCCVFRWSDDFRVIVEERWSPQFPPSNLQWLQPHPLYQPGGWGSVTIPTTNGSLTWPSGEPYTAPGHDTGVTWKLDIPGTLSTGPVKSPLVFK